MDQVEEFVNIRFGAPKRRKVGPIVFFSGLGFFSSLSFIALVQEPLDGFGLLQLLHFVLGVFFVVLFGGLVCHVIVQGAESEANNENPEQDEDVASTRRILRTNKHVLFHGFLFWLFYYIGALHWLFMPLTIEINKYWFLIPIATIAIPAYLALPMIIPIYLTLKLKISNALLRAIMFSVMCFFVIYFLGNYAPGFPWALPGYVWNGDLYVSQALSLWGVYGQTFLTLLLGGIFGFGVYLMNFGKRDNKRKGKIAYASVFVILFILMFGGMFRLWANDISFTDYRVRCVQGNVLQKDKMNRRRSFDNLNHYLDLSSSQSKYKNWRSDFVIWPEANLPYLYMDQEGLRKTLASIIPDGGYLLTGAVRKNLKTRKVYNSVIVLDNLGNNVAYYDKRHLVPFGEYIPLRNFIPKVFEPIANNIGDFDIGENLKPIELKGLKISCMVCYEGIFPGEFVFDDTDVIVNVTNDGWFGDSTELFQHLFAVRARAIEEGIPLIRVTNYGISAVFDAYGRKVDMVDAEEEGVIDCFIPKKIDKTIYRKFFVDNFLLKH